MSDEVVDDKIVFDLVGINEIKEFSNLSPIFRIVPEQVINIITEELWEYAMRLRSDPMIPDEYKSALAVSVLEEQEKIVLHIVYTKQADGYRTDANKALFSKFGPLEWSLYKCPRRKYMGGHYAPKYTMPTYIRDKWKEYEPTFESRIDARFKQLEKELSSK
jgi:hypothetical protein